jgi:hypothetical protein
MNDVALPCLTGLAMPFIDRIVQILQVYSGAYECYRYNNAIWSELGTRWGLLGLEALGGRLGGTASAWHD